MRVLSFRFKYDRSSENSETGSAHKGLYGVDRILATVAVMLNVAVANLDIAIANTALPQIARSLQLTAGQAIWVTASYQLAMVFALLPAIVCAERYSARRIAIAGIIVFSIASLFCGLSPSLFPLISGRVFQGIGGACIAGTGIALTRSIFPERMLGVGMGINAFVVGFSISAGPSVTSLVLGLASWPWLFLINVPIGAIGILLGLFAMPPSVPAATRIVRPTTLTLGAALMTACCLSLHFVAHGLPEFGAITAAAAILLMFLLANLRRSVLTVALPIDLFAKPAFTLSAITALLSFMAMATAFVSLPFLFQLRFGFTQIEAGFLFSTWPVFATLISLLAGTVSDRVSPAVLCSIGLLAIAIGLASLGLLPADSTAAAICVGLALCGTGFGLFQAPNMKALLLASPANRSNSAGGISTLVGILGQSLGAAMVAAMFNLHGYSGSIGALYAGALAALLASIVSLSRLCISQHEPV